MRISGMYFFEEFKDYVGFTDADVARLHELKPFVEPHFQRIVMRFYDALMENSRARNVFSGPEQIIRLRCSLLKWLGELFEGPFDDHYCKARLHIGEVHVNVGLLPHFMFGAMNLIRVDLTKIVAKWSDDPDQNARYLTSVERILDLDLTLMVQSYWNVMMKQKLQLPAALTTGLAHEIRNPLNAIGLQVTLLERKLHNADVQYDVFQPILEAVRSELRRIHVVNSEIMDFAKPIEVYCESTNIQRILQELKQTHSTSLETANIELTFHIQDSPYIWCDADRLNQVIVNLLNNAVEAMPEHGGKIHIQVEPSRNGNIITFDDNGNGMEPTLKNRIFDLFYTSKAAGTGIGLPIARKIIEAHGGSIDVSSLPNVGTQFILHLPGKTSTRVAS